MWTKSYIISQILVVIMYVFLGISYFSKERNKILISNIFAHIFQTISPLFLNGYTGAMMGFIMVVRDGILYVDNKLNKNENRKKDIFILCILLIMIIIGTIFTYDGVLSLLSVFATLVLLFGIWQKDSNKYKIYGFIGSILWLLYYIYLKSIFAIVLESLLCICTVIAYLKEYKKKTIK